LYKGNLAYQLTPPDDEGGEMDYILDYPTLTGLFMGITTAAFLKVFFPSITSDRKIVSIATVPLIVPLLILLRNSIGSDTWDQIHRSLVVLLNVCVWTFWVVAVLTADRKSDILRELIAPEPPLEIKEEN